MSLFKDFRDNVVFMWDYYKNLLLGDQVRAQMLAIMINDPDTWYAPDQLMTIIEAKTGKNVLVGSVLKELEILVNTNMVVKKFVNESGNTTSKYRFCKEELQKNVIEGV